MTDEKLKEIVLTTLGEVAPDVDTNNIDPDVEFRDQFDFDSMDFLNFATALHKKLQIDIPELEYPKLGTLNSCIAYLEAARNQ